MSRFQIACSKITILKSQTQTNHQYCVHAWIVELNSQCPSCQGGSGSASNIKFQNIVMQNVANPIIIDQNYCDQNKPCKKQVQNILLGAIDQPFDLICWQIICMIEFVTQGRAVQVKNVIFQNIQGTSSSDVAINLDCSKSFPCQGILLQNINLKGQGGETAKALCNNVNLASMGVISPRCSWEEGH